jgi:hypothetical protein
MHEKSSVVNALINYKRLGMALVALAVPTIFVAGCESQSDPYYTSTYDATIAAQRAVLIKRGLSGEQKLALIQPTSQEVQSSTVTGNVSGSAHGLFFLILGAASAKVSGTVTGQSQTSLERNVLISWQANANPPVITTSEVPLSKVQVVEESTPGDDAVKFDLDLNYVAYLGSQTDQNCFVVDKQGNTEYWPSQCMSTTDSVNLNTFLDDPNALEVATLSLDPTDAAEFFAQVGK